MTGRRGRGALPALLVVVVVTGVGTGAVVATSLGLVPLFGQPRLSVEGWSTTAGDLGRGVRESLAIAVPATVLALVVGLVLASAVLDARGRPGAVVRAVALGVLAVPHLVGAASVGQLLSGGGVAARVLGVAPADWPALVAGPWPTASVLELAWKESAFVALVVVASLARGHRARQDAAAVLGAGAWQRWSRVLLPSAAPSLATAGLVVLVYSVGSFEVPALLGRAYPEPLPVLAYRLFGSIDLTDRPAAAAAAALGALLALACAGVALTLAAGVVRRGPLTLGGTR